MAMTQLQMYQRDKVLLEELLVHLANDLQRSLNQSAELLESMNKIKRRLIGYDAKIDKLLNQDKERTK